MESPLITIIVAVFNGEKTLQRCIDSISEQSYQNKELVIIDGGSTDTSIDIIKANQEKISYWISESDSGIYDAWNKGLKQATGDWVAFLGADDTYLPEALEAYASFLLMHEHVPFDYLSSRVNLVKENNLIRTFGKPWSWKAFSRYMNVAHVGSLHNKSLYENYGYYDTGYKICADYEFLLRPRSLLKAGFLNVVTVNMSIGGASDSYRAQYETRKAKIISGGRSPLKSYMENMMAVIQMFIRKLIWY